EARAIQVELERSGYRDCFEFVTWWATEPLDVLRELRRVKPVVVHISSGRWTAIEARPDQPQEASSAGNHSGQAGDVPCGLRFQDGDGRVQMVPTAALAEAFGAA